MSGFSPCLSRPVSKSFGSGLAPEAAFRALAQTLQPLQLLHLFRLSTGLRLESRQGKPSSSQIALQLFYILKKGCIQPDRFRTDDVLL
jgi:hypothetical protein